MNQMNPHRQKNVFVLFQGWFKFVSIKLSFIDREIFIFILFAVIVTYRSG